MNDKWKLLSFNVHRHGEWFSFIISLKLFPTGISRTVISDRGKQHENLIHIWASEVWYWCDEIVEDQRRDYV